MTAALQPHDDSSSSEDDSSQKAQEGDNSEQCRRLYSVAVADAAAPDDCPGVCLVAPRELFAVLRGHAQFCERCARRIAELTSESRVVHPRIFQGQSVCEF